MTFYIIILVFILYLIRKYDFRSEDYSMRNTDWNIGYYVLYVLLASVPIFSYQMGSDVQNYEKWYCYEVKYISQFSFEDFRYEPIFCLVMSLFKTIGLSWFVVRALIVGFVNFAVFSFGKRYVKHFFTFILLYFLLHFYEMNFEPIRQSIAMGIFLLSISYLEKGEKLKYFIWIIVAFGFHISSALALLLPFIKWMKFNWVSYLSLFAFLFIGNYVNTHFSDLITLTSLIGQEDYYELYLKSDLVNNQLNLNGIIALVITKVLPVIISLKMIKCAKADTFRFMEPAAFMLVIFIVLRAAIPLLDRFVLYWGIIQVAILAEALFITSVPRKAPAINQLFRLYIVLSFALNIYMYYNNENQFGFKNYRRFYPYNSVIDKHVDTERRDYQLNL